MSTHTFIKQGVAILAGVAQWIECWPENQKVTQLDSQSGHMPGIWARSSGGGSH